MLQCYTCFWPPKPGFAPSQSIEDLWRTEWHWDVFPPSASVCLCQYHSMSAAHSLISLRNRQRVHQMPSFRVSFTLMATVIVTRSFGFNVGNRKPAIGHDLEPVPCTFHSLLLLLRHMFMLSSDILLQNFPCRNCIHIRSLAHPSSTLCPTHRSRLDFCICNSKWYR
jgi:hypothetical protein